MLRSMFVHTHYLRKCEAAHFPNDDTTAPPAVSTLQARVLISAERKEFQHV
jgi:hypothetical protein